MFNIKNKIKNNKETLTIFFKKRTLGGSTWDQYIGLAWGWNMALVHFKNSLGACNEHNQSEAPWLMTVVSRPACIRMPPRVSKKDFWASL